MKLRIATEAGLRRAGRPHLSHGRHVQTSVLLMAAVLICAIALPVQGSAAEAGVLNTPQVFRSCALTDGSAAQRGDRHLHPTEPGLRHKAGTPRRSGRLPRVLLGAPRIKRFSI